MSVVELLALAEDLLVKVVALLNAVEEVVAAGKCLLLAVHAVADSLVLLANGLFRWWAIWQYQNIWLADLESILSKLRTWYGVWFGVMSGSVMVEDIYLYKCSGHSGAWNSWAYIKCSVMFQF